MALVFLAFSKVIVPSFDSEVIMCGIHMYMVVDLKVLDSIVYDDDPEHINISFGESFFSSWRK